MAQQQTSHLTVGQVAQLYQIDEWRIRRVVDSLPVSIPRAGRYRLVPREYLAEIAVELDRRGWLPTTPNSREGRDNA